MKTNAQIMEKLAKLTIFQRGDIIFDNASRALVERTLRETTTEQLLSENNEPPIELIHFWLDYMQGLKQKVFISRLTLDSAEDMLVLVHKYKLASKVADTVERKKSLAGIFMALSYNYTKVAPRKEETSSIIDDVMATWVNRPTEQGASKDLQKCIDFLYGEAMWSLYRTDSPVDYEMINFLWKSPFIPAIQSDSQALSDKLPFDLT